MTQSPKGPHSSERASTDDELGFDPDSPDAADPQVDPIGAAIAPLDREKKPSTEKKPPYDPLGDLKK